MRRKYNRSQSNFNFNNVNDGQVSINNPVIINWARKDKTEIVKEREYIVEVDYISLVCYLLLTVFGLFMILNISANRSSIIHFYKQFLWLVLSLIAFVISLRYVNLKKVRKIIFPILLINILLLGAVLLFGNTVKGATRSLTFLGVNVQPSVIARGVIVLYFAHIIDKKKMYLDQTHPLGFIRHFMPLILMTLTVFGLVLYQRHLSTLIISSLTILSILFLAKIRLTTILAIIFSCILIFSLIISKGASYRSSRIDIYRKYSLFHNLLDKSVSEIESDDYQIRESLIALSSGGLFGKGINRGRSKHYYLPEARTDYIFAVIGEELGFLGGLVVFLLYITIFIRSMMACYKQEDLFLKLAGMGLALNIFNNVLVNMGVAISVLPSTGVTLPFISYGGTSLLINSICLALILNITATRKKW